MDFEKQISMMTLEEKCSLLSGGGQFYSKAVERLNIPSMFLADGPNGVRKQAGAADHLGLNESLPATCYPTAATVANCWDLNLATELGKRLGEESAALFVNVLLGPGLNMKRSALGGRNFEYFAEDPYLAGKLAAAYICGIQSQGVAACPKHFAANNQELRRMHNDSVVDLRALHEIYLTGFEIAVKEGKPLSIMSCYNRINGVYTSEDEALLQKLLRDEWGFDGFVVTDWGGSNNRVLGLLAGNHLEMPGTKGQSDQEVLAAVNKGQISQAVLDKRLKEYLAVLFKTVLPKDTPQFNIEDNHLFAKKVAEESIVLLKNQDDILPLKPKTKVAVLGDFAEKPRYQGSGSSQVNATKIDVPLDVIRAEKSLEFVGFNKAYDRFGKQDDALLLEAAELAKKADVVLLYMGLDELSESEGMDRQHMRLMENQLQVLQKVAEANPNVVVVLCGASPVETPWIESCKAIVHGYLGGQAGASAMLSVLLGAVNPSGKLNESWPLKYEDSPAFLHFPGKEATAEYRESIYIGYRYYETAEVPVRFAFGFGLSYTSFAYSNIALNGNKLSFNICNTGKVPGAEVAQLYVSMPKSGIYRAKKELKGFAKVFLQPGEEREIAIEIDDKAFRYYNTKTCRFEVEQGNYVLQVGASCQDIRLSINTEIEGTKAELPYDKELLPSYFSGKIANVEDLEFERILGRAIPQSQWERKRPLDRNDTFSQLFYAKSWLGRLVYKILTSQKEKAEQKGKPDLNILFIYNMPFRGVAKMMGGAVDMAMVDALLVIFNGRFFAGAGALISAYFKMKKCGKEFWAALENAKNNGG